MLTLPVKSIYLANDLVDMRKSYDTLSDIVKFYMDKDPLSGDAFVFIGKRRNRMKILIWEESGFWLCSKRLEQGTFSKKVFESYTGRSIKISPAEWYNLLEGIVIISSRKLKRFKGLQTA